MNSPSSTDPTRARLTWQAINGVLFALMALALYVVAAVFIVRMINDGVAASRVFAFAVCVFAGFAFGRLALVWWQAFREPGDTENAIRRRLRSPDEGGDG